MVAKLHINNEIYLMDSFISLKYNVKNVIYMRVQRIEINQDIPGHVNTGMAT